MTKDEALRLAWGALEDIGDEWGFTSERTVPKRKEAITAIKEALAQPEHGWTPERIAGMARLKEAQDKKLTEPEQEPVGEIVDAIEGAFKCSFTKMLPVGTKLYTTPSQRKPLTDKRVYKLWNDKYRSWIGGEQFESIARAIEAAHNSKEQL